MHETKYTKSQQLFSWKKAFLLPRPAVFTCNRSYINNEFMTKSLQKQSEARALQEL